MKRIPTEIREAKETETYFKFKWKFQGKSYWHIIPARNDKEARDEFYNEICGSWVHDVVVEEYEGDINRYVKTSNAQ